MNSACPPPVLRRSCMRMGGGGTPTAYGHASSAETPTPRPACIYTGPPREAVGYIRGERVIVDEAGMLDQDTAHALLTVTAEAGATVALVGDRAQLPAVGRGGVLNMAAQIRGRTYDMSELHRFTDPEYAALTLAMRDRENPGDVFDQLAAMNLVTLHADDDVARDHITADAHDGEAITVATNDEAAALNERIRTGRVESGEVDDTVTATGSDGLSIGAGDLIQTRKNDSDLGVANRQQWIVQHVAEDGTVYARETASGRKNPARSRSRPSMWESMRICPTPRPPTASRAQPSMPRTRSVGGDERGRRLRRHDPRPPDEPAHTSSPRTWRMRGRSSSTRWNATRQTAASTTPPGKPPKPYAASPQTAP